MRASTQTAPPRIRDDVMVNPDWIAARLADPSLHVVEIDVSRAAYDDGHIPHAVLWNAYSDLRLPGYAPIDDASFAELLSRSGITPDSTVIFYGYAAYLGFWLMKRYRHRDVRVMDGVRERWEHAGQPWSLEPAIPDPASYPTPHQAPAALTEQEALRRRIEDPESLILDVRSREEFDGERFWPSGATEDAGRAGHIPGAVHLPCDLVRSESGELNPPDELRAVFDAHGVSGERRVITYCTIGNRASQVWFCLKQMLGYPHVSVYYGSWAEWGKSTAAPIA